METRNLELDETHEMQLTLAAELDQAQVETRFRGKHWREAAVDYFRAQRAAGRAEMERLMKAAGIAPPASTEQARLLLDGATRIYLGIEPGDASIERRDGGVLVLEVRDCPVYQRLLGKARGITACSCFARRAGWYEAIGEDLWDEQETNLKWGDPYCSVTIHLPVSTAA